VEHNPLSPLRTIFTRAADADQYRAPHLRWPPVSEVKARLLIS